MNGGGQIEPTRARPLEIRRLDRGVEPVDQRVWVLHESAKAILLIGVRIGVLLGIGERRGVEGHHLALPKEDVASGPGSGVQTRAVLGSTG